MNPGIAKGFVKFGTVAHRVLLHAHENGKISNEVLREDLGIGPQAASAVLQRLHEGLFLRRVGANRASSGRRQAVYSLWTPERERVGGDEYVHRLTGAERSRTYRQRRAIMVSSVFAFRGQISLAPDSP